MSNRLSVGMKRWVGCMVLALSVIGLASCKTVSEGRKNTTRTFNTVVVDAGHGGRDSGAYRRYGPPEKKVTLDVATRLARDLRESQLQTVMTRTSDTFVSLDTRVDIQNNTKNSIFVSIHFNDSRRRVVKGFETYYYSHYAASLARRIQQKLCTIRGAVDRGVRTANFRVLRKGMYPAVLVECGYLSNRADGSVARKIAYRELLADKIAEAIVEERFGPGVYHAPAMAGAFESPPPANPPPPGEGPETVREGVGVQSQGPGLAPSKLRTGP
jgi:N-acetylmuramoyl-L-alanine amidase